MSERVFPVVLTFSDLPVERNWRYGVPDPIAVCCVPIPTPWCRSFFRSLCCFSCCDSSETQEPRNVLMGAYLSQPVTDKVRTLVLTPGAGLQKADTFSKITLLKGHATGNVMRTCNEIAVGGRRRRECRVQVWRLCNAGLANRNGKHMLLFAQNSIYVRQSRLHCLVSCM